MNNDQWIMVQNPGELEIWGIRLLGLSTKSADKIGQFGTGLKETIALVFRLKSELIIYAGETKYEFSIQKQDGQDEIGFIVDDDGEWRGLGLHPDFGKRDWNSPWQVLREIFCNAVDEGLSDLHYDLVTEVEGVAGATRVYIKCNNQLKNAFYTIDRKLLMLGSITPVSHGPFGAVYEKVGIGEEIQVYHKKVWIAQFGSLSLFDYEVDALKITESRTTDQSSVSNNLPHILLYSSPKVIQRILAVVKDQGTDRHKLPFELNHTHPSDWRQATQGYDPEGTRDMTKHMKEGEVKHKWAETWFNLYGHDAVAIRGEQHQYDNIKDTGKNPVVVIEGWVSILEILGIPTHKTVLDADQLDGRKIVGQMDGVHIVWKQLQKAELTAGMNQPMVTIYQEPIADAKQGFVRDRQVFLNEAVIGSEQENIVMTEQFAKYICDGGSHTEKLQGWLVTSLTRLLENNDGA